MPLLHRKSFVIATFVLASTAGWVGAQPPPPVPVNAQAPQIDLPRPLGARRGTTIELTLTGKNLAEPTGLGLSFPAKASFPAPKSGTAGLTVHLEIPTDTPLGMHTLRLATKRGISNLRFLCIDDLPEATKQAGNSSREKAQRIQHPTVLTGKAEKELGDFYRFTVAAGERLAIEVLGRRLGSVFDPQLTLYDAKTGKELPAGHNNDAAGLPTDARLVYTFKDAGDYLIEVRDTLWRGGDDFWYRLRVGDFPCATTPYPLAVRRGAQQTIQFAGPPSAAAVPFEVTAPTSLFASSLALTPRSARGLAGWPVFLAVSDLEERLEQEPNNDLAHANHMAVPGALSARFLESNDLDCFTFTAKKGVRYTIEVQSIEWNSPTEVYMIVKDAKGAQLAAGNPQTGPRIDFTAPADGEFTIVVEHLLTWNGPTETYRLLVAPYEPGFDLSLVTDRLDVPAGGGAALPISVVRRDYTGPIDLAIVHPAGLTGHGRIRAGANAGTLFVNAVADMPLGAYPLQVQGVAVIGGKVVAQPAKIRSQVSAALGGLAYPPPNLLDTGGVAVIEKTPFALKAKFDANEMVRGKAIALTIELVADKGWSEEVKLSAVGLPDKVKADLKPIAKGQVSAKATFTPAADAPLGDHEFSIAGRVTIQGKEYVALCPPIVLTLAK